jgi:hypothetical protein
MLISVVDCCWLVPDDCHVSGQLWGIRLQGLHAGESHAHNMVPAILCVLSFIVIRVPVLCWPIFAETILFAFASGRWRSLATKSATIIVSPPLKYLCCTMLVQNFRARAATLPISNVCELY